MEELTDMRELNGCTMASTEESRWKEATQRYIANMLLRNLDLRTALLSGTYRESPTIKFTINERGHIRDINAPACVDRVIQKSVSRNVLIPAIRPHLIYDNYASLKDRGTHFARRRLIMMLRSYIRANGTDGYVLLGDVSKYFDSVDHEVLKRQIAPLLEDQPADVIALIHGLWQGTEPRRRAAADTGRRLPRPDRHVRQGSEEREVLRSLHGRFLRHRTKQGRT